MIVLALATALAVSAATPAPTVPYNVQSYSAEMERLGREVDSLKDQPQVAEDLRKSLPDSWQVSDGDAEVTVGSEFLRQALTDFQKASPERKKVLLDELSRRLAAMRAEGQEFVKASRADAEARRRLDDILAASEFSSVHPPSMFEIWWDRILAAIDRWLTRASSRMPDVPGLGRFFIWCSIAIVTSALAVWLYRYARVKEPERVREVIPFAPSAKHWRLWLEEADAEALKGNWRDAVHLAYWAGVSYLEGSGLWRPDRARTPREYVKAIAPSNPVRPQFNSFTRRFEAIWYGSRAAAPADFQHARTELEGFGCR